MPNATTGWFKQHPKATAALALAVALASLALVSISSFGHRAGGEPTTSPQLTSAEQKKGGAKGRPSCVQ